MSAGGTRVRVTPEHPIMVAPGTYRQAGFLFPGDLVFLFRAGALKAEAIQSIHRLPGKRPAYNLLVSPGGTFISGDLVLHNKGCFLPDSPILTGGRHGNADQCRETGRCALGLYSLTDTWYPPAPGPSFASKRTSIS